MSFGSGRFGWRSMPGGTQRPHDHPGRRCADQLSPQKPPTRSRWPVSSRTSRWSSVSRSPSALVVPGRRPPSMPACWTQPRRVSGSTRTRGPIRSTAAFNDRPCSCPRASADGDQPLRPLPQLRRVLPPCWHDPTFPWHHTLHETGDGPPSNAVPECDTTFAPSAVTIGYDRAVVSCTLVPLRPVSDHHFNSLLQRPG